MKTRKRFVVNYVFSSPFYYLGAMHGLEGIRLVDDGLFQCLADDATDIRTLGYCPKYRKNSSDT